VGFWICISWRSVLPSLVSLRSPEPPTSIFKVPLGPRFVLRTCGRAKPSIPTPPSKQLNITLRHGTRANAGVDQTSCRPLAALMFIARATKRFACSASWFSILREDILPQVPLSPRTEILRMRFDFPPPTSVPPRSVNRPLPCFCAKSGVARRLRSLVRGPISRSLALYPIRRNPEFGLRVTASAMRLALLLGALSAGAAFHPISVGPPSQRSALLPAGNRACTPGGVCSVQALANDDSVDRPRRRDQAKETIKRASSG